MRTSNILALVKRTTVVVVTLLFLACAIFSPQAQALSAAQKQLYNNNILFYDIDGSTCGTSAAATGKVDMTGTNVAIAYHYLQTAYNSRIIAAAAVGNMMVESTPKIDPTATNTDRGIHYGIVQWGGSRLPAMRAWVKAQAAPDNDPTTINGQLPYVIHELNNGYKSTLAGLKQQTTARMAATYWKDNYEVVGDNSGKRENNADHLYNDATLNAGLPADSGSGSPTSSTDTSTVGNCVSAISPDCTAAAGAVITGNKKILCEAQKYAGIYYRWAGGWQGIEAFHAGCPDPAHPPNNHPHGAGSDPTNHGQNGNPSPCATDCSGLVAVAIAEAFDLTTSDHGPDNGSANWKHLPSIADAQPGDVVTIPGQHIEIVDHVDAAKSRVYTFGSHETGTMTGPTSAKFSHYSGGAWRYTGPGSTTTEPQT